MKMKIFPDNKYDIPRVLLTRTFVLLSFYLILFLSVPAVIQASEVRILILQTTDIHSHIRPKEKIGGWLRIATLINRTREEAGDKNTTLLIDCGDTLSGTISGSFSQGEAPAAIMNYLDYDAWIIGNHDFDFGQERLAYICGIIKADKVAANLIWEQPSSPVLPWKIYMKNGAKIAVIGMTSPNLDNWLWGSNPKGLRLESAAADEVIERIMPSVLESRPDMIILAVHHGRFSPEETGKFNIALLAEKYPQIDLILGGHSHIEIPGERIGHRTWFVQAGKHGESLAWIEAYIDPKKHRVKRIQSKLIPADETVVPDTIATEKIKKWIDKAESFSKRIIGKTVNPILPQKNGEWNCSMNELFARAIAEETESVVAFHGTVVADVKFAGAITEQNLFNAIPYEDTICTIHLNNEEMRKIMSEQIKQYDKGRFQSPWGIYAKIDDNGAIQGEVRFKDGKIWQDKSKRIKASFSSYVLAGAGGRFPVLKEIASNPRCKPEDTGIPIRDALRNYIRNNSPLKISATNWLQPY